MSEESPAVPVWKRRRNLVAGGFVLTVTLAGGVVLTRGEDPNAWPEGIPAEKDTVPTGPLAVPVIPKDCGVSAATIKAAVRNATPGDDRCEWESADLLGYANLRVGLITGKANGRRQTLNEAIGLFGNPFKRSAEDAVPGPEKAWPVKGLGDLAVLRVGNGLAILRARSGNAVVQVTLDSIYAKEKRGQDIALRAAAEVVRAITPGAPAEPAVVTAAPKKATPVPDPCTLPDKDSHELVKKRRATPDTDAGHSFGLDSGSVRNCTWTVTNSKLMVSTLAAPPDSLVDATRYVRTEYVSKHVQARDDVRRRSIRTKAFRPVSGLGDEGFVSYGSGDETYDGVGVGTVLFRAGDTLYRVTYSGRRNHKPMPRRMAVENAYKVAKDVAKKP